MANSKVSYVHVACSGLHDDKASNLEASVWAQEGQYVDLYSGRPPTEIPRRYKNVVYYIHQTPLFSWRVEGGLGSRLVNMQH